MKNLKKLTILHSNDMHGDFLAEDVDKKLIGGVSMLSGYINKVRDSEETVVYTVSGDMFRGSVIDSEFKGLSTIEIMNLLAPDVVTLGNHEVDYGIAHLLFIEKCAKFPIINANLYVKNNRARLFRSHVVLEKGGMKILFIGILTEEVISQTKQDSLVGAFVDVDEAAAEVAKICNSYHSVDIDFTVLLTHIGYEEDKALARRLDPACGVDVIIGGHSHTILDKPAEENGILIVQAGTGTDQIGRFDIMVNADTNSVDSYKWELVPIDSGHCPRDPDLEALIESYKTETDKKYARVVTRFKKMLTHPERTQETELGNLFSTILKNSLGLDVMLLGSGSIRNDKLGPIVQYGGLTETFPYDDCVYMIKASGRQLKRMVRHILRDEAFGGHTEFYQFSEGVAIEYSRGKKELLKFTFEGEPIDDERLYSIGLQKFHFKNLEKFLGVTPEEIELNFKPKVVSTSCLDILEEYLVSNQQIDQNTEGRLGVVD